MIIEHGKFRSRLPLIALRYKMKQLCFYFLSLVCPSGKRTFLYVAPTLNFTLKVMSIYD